MSVVIKVGNELAVCKNDSRTTFLTDARQRRYEEGKFIRAARFKSLQVVL